MGWWASKRFVGKHLIIVLQALRAAIAAGLAGCALFAYANEVICYNWVAWLTLGIVIASRERRLQIGIGSINDVLTLSSLHIKSWSAIITKLFTFDVDSRVEYTCSENSIQSLFSKPCAQELFNGAIFQFNQKPIKLSFRLSYLAGTAIDRVSRFLAFIYAMCCRVFYRSFIIRFCNSLFVLSRLLCAWLDAFSFWRKKKCWKNF